MLSRDFRDQSFDQQAALSIVAIIVATIGIWIVWCDFCATRHDARLTSIIATALSCSSLSAAAPPPPSLLKPARPSLLPRLAGVLSPVTVAVPRSPFTLE